jgi:hypothetical protein
VSTPAFESRKEGLYACISRMGMQSLGGKQAHEVFGFQPYSFVPHRSPEEDERLGIEQTALMG